MRTRDSLAAGRLLKQRGQKPVQTETADKGWLGFGLELANAGLSAEEEQQLEPRARASLAAGRVLRARQANATKKNVLGTLDEPTEDQGQAGWLTFGLELAGAGREWQTIRHPIYSVEGMRLI